MIFNHRTLLFAGLMSLMPVSAVSQYRQTMTHTVTTTISSSGLHGQSSYSESIEAYDMTTVDVQPTFPGGMSALYSYINNSRRYPASAYQNGIQGRVLCSFVVNSDGTLSHISVIKGIDPSLDSEAIRIIEEMPRWQAGSIDNKPVPIYCILPIAFRL